MAALGMAALVMATLSWTGCARHPSKEQLQRLEETKQAALAAEQQLAQCQQQKADLEKQVKAKQDELQKVRAEKAAVQSRLQGM
jgi:septal ring factor EnvC (AmiA/AmiB activator)